MSLPEAALRAPARLGGFLPVFLLLGAAVSAAGAAALPRGTAGVTPASGSRQSRAEGRDPFRPPERVGPETRPPGLAGVRIVEASVRGILRRSAASGDSGAPDRPAAGDSVILEAPDGRGFVASPGAKLLDGVLLRVEEDGAVFRTNRRPPSEIFRPLSTGAPPDPPPDPP